MLEMMKGYLQLAAGLGEMSRRKAMDVARDLVEGTPVAGLRSGSGTGPDALTAQVTAVADELMTIGRQNRRLLAQVVRTETEAVLASLGVRAERGTVGGGRGERLDDQLTALRERVDDLERQLRGGTARTGAPAPARSARVAAKGRAGAAKKTTTKTATKTAKATAARATTGTTKAAAARRSTAGAAKGAETKRAPSRMAKTAAKRTAAATTRSAGSRRPARGATA